MHAFITTVSRAVAAVIMTATLNTAVMAQSQSQMMNFRDAEIGAVIDDMALMTGYTFVVDPEVRGRVTIVSQTALSVPEAFQVFLSALRVSGYAVVPTVRGAYQIVPENEGLRTGAPLADMVPDAGILSSVYRLRHISAQDAVRAVAPMLSASGSANSIPGGNLVVVVDHASNVRAIEAALAAADRDRNTVEVITLENLPAEDMARIVNNLLARDKDSGGMGQAPQPVTMVAVSASNALVLRGEPSAIEEWVSLIRRIDKISASTRSFRVIYLSHARGDQLLPILTQFAEAMTRSEAGGGRPASIAYHAPTNAIIANAEPDILRELEQVVVRLDIRRPQVQVEAIVVEVSDQAARDLGVQFLLSGDGSNATPFAYTRYGASRQPDLLALTGAILTGAISTGDDSTASASDTGLRNLALNALLGSRGGTFGVGGEFDDGSLFGLIINAFDADTDSNVLSKPQLMVLDNEEATLLVGQEIPVTTGETLGDNNSNPFRQIRRENVGVQLFIRPQINEGDAIRLQIRQEVSSVAGPVSVDFVELITNERRIETTVLADDGEIIVLGGLIETDEQTAQSRVPGLSGIPGVGRLFRNQSQSLVRRNLMVFIRPTIVRDAEDMRSLARRSYDYTVDRQRVATGGASSLEDAVSVMIGGESPFGDGRAQSGQE